MARRDRDDEELLRAVAHRRGDADHGDEEDDDGIRLLRDTESPSEAPPSVPAPTRASCSVSLLYKS